MKPLLLFAIVALACAESSLEFSEPLLIRIRVPPDIVTRASLRSAVVFTLSGGPGEHAVVDDVRVDASSPTADLLLSLPERATLARATPTVRLTVNRSTTVSAFRPRLVVYADEDGDGHFSPNLSTGGGPDQLLAIDEDGQGYAAILDLAGLLEELPLDEAEAFYEATDGRYTPFVFTTGLSTITLSNAPATVPVSFDPALATASFECRRAVRVEVGTTEHEIVLDEAVAPELCGLGDGGCTVTALAALEPPEVPLGSYCRSDGAFEAWITLTSRSRCDGCSCVRDTVMRVWIASKESLPDYWPCGSQAYRCSQQEKLTLSLGCNPS